MNNDIPPIVPTEDFWSRQAHAQKHEFAFVPLGIPARITSNNGIILDAAKLSASRYIHTTADSDAPIHIKFIVRQNNSEALPDDLTKRLIYSGVDEWITQSAGEWGHSFGNLRTREACIFLSRATAADTRLVSRYFIDHYLLNFILTEWAMLHASCVYHALTQRLIMIVGTHNSGKSTTALQLTRGGYKFLADGMAMLKIEQPSAGSNSFIVGGYPIGEVKLREDVLAMFPAYQGETTMVREQMKTIVDLRRVHPNQVIETLIRPTTIHVCALERHAMPKSRVAALSYDEALQMFSANTAYWDQLPQLEHNSVTLHHLLRTAKLHRLIIGTDPESIIAAVDNLT